MVSGGGGDGPGGGGGHDAAHGAAAGGEAEERRGRRWCSCAKRTEPATKLRPEDLRDAARAQLKRQGLAIHSGQI